jgi:hypothetical protein
MKVVVVVGEGCRFSLVLNSYSCGGKRPPLFQKLENGDL